MQNFLFDFDGTLANSGPTVTMAAQEAFKSCHLRIPSEHDILDHMGLPIEAFFPKLAPTASDETMQRVYQAFRYYCEGPARRKTRLFPGVENTLTQLFKQQKRLFIVSSNLSDNILQYLHQFGVTKDFIQVIGADMVAHTKPAPDGVDQIVDNYHLDRNETMVIGDARYDLQMGKNAHVKTCAATWGAFNVKSLRAEHPDYLIKDPRDLLKI